MQNCQQSGRDAPSPPLSTSIDDTRRSMLALSLLVACTFAADPVSAHDVIWTSPSRDVSGSMPIGNGDLAANVWVDADGALSMYLSKSDAWDDNARLLKLGRIRVEIDSNQHNPGDAFRQRLDLEHGEIEIVFGTGGSLATIRVRVDANRPVYVIEVESERPTSVTVTLEHWRLAPRTVKEVTWSDVYCVDWAKPPSRPVVTEADVILPATSTTHSAEFLWYHRNERTPIPATFELQNITSLLPTVRDPILHRTFGALVTGPGLVPAGERALRAKVASTQHRVEIWALTQFADTPDVFTRAIRGLASTGANDDPDLQREAHRTWWKNFWSRSWIRLSDNGTSAPFPLSDNALPVAIGSDPAGSNSFKGEIERVLVLGHALDASGISALATNPDAAPDDILINWRAGDSRSIAESPELDAQRGITIAAWLVPDQQDPGGGRVIDKCPIGRSDGWMLDTYPSNSLRFIGGDPAITFDARLTPGRRTFVAATYDPKTAQRRLFIDGAMVKESSPQEPPAKSIEQAYVLQRYISACAGRGGSPIKFNGSLFTVPRTGHDEGDPDYRRWGPGYWFQNTRLIYWPMFASGDIDMTDAFFRMYREALPLVQAMHRLQHGDRLAPGAATFFETVYFWGMPDNSSFGWDRSNATPGEVTNPYIRHYRSGSIELLVMALERYEYTRDAAFLRDTVLPLSQAFGAFYATYFPRNDDGTLRFAPAASLETWHEAIDPLPEIAGLRDAVDRLLRIDLTLLDAADPHLREKAIRFRASLPPLPIGTSDAGSVLLPAAEYRQLANVENPELYAIFPYRTYGVGKPDLDVAQRTFVARKNRANAGWCQDSIQAAHLGRATEAAAQLARRAASKDQKSRFPAFWGPNYDWVPDQAHGVNILTTLQSMLVQCDGDRIVMMPAWPRGWDCEFRMHAPKNTVLEGSIRDGRLASLRVTPPERVYDVEIVPR